jgi:type VI secretion system protein ImpG
MDVQQHEIQRFEKGFLLRGVDIEITLDENGFTGEGDIHLFGEMLNRFLHCMRIFICLISLR